MTAATSPFSTSRPAENTAGAAPNPSLRVETTEQLQQYLDPEPNPKFKQLATVLLASQMMHKVSDVHIHSNGRVLARVHGVLQPFKLPGFTDTAGVLSAEKAFPEIEEALLGSTKWESFGTKVHRSRTHQIRVQPVRSMGKMKKLIVRVQLLRPPALRKTLELHPEFIESLTLATGLVLVAGPIGAGKTTIASSIVQHWAAGRAKHIATVEDPVEYIIPTEIGDVTHIECNLLGRKGAENVPTLEEILPDLQRADIDGLMVGEIRDRITRRTCIDFASTREPVVATMHAGSISDAIFRLLNPAGESDGYALRLAVAQCLHSVIYVDMAYKADGSPSPVVCALPGHNAKLRSMMVQTPEQLPQLIESLMREPKSSDGGITYAEATAAATKNGVKAEVLAAMFPAKP